MNIRWTPRAVSDCERILNYLETNWGEKVRVQYIERIEFILQIISRYPNLYRKTEARQHARRCVITKHSSLFFRIKNDTIELLATSDNRQEQI